MASGADRYENDRVDTSRLDRGCECDLDNLVARIRPRKLAPNFCLDPSSLSVCRASRRWKWRFSLEDVTKLYKFRKARDRDGLIAIVPLLIKVIF